MFRNSHSLSNLKLFKLLTAQLAENFAFQVRAPLAFFPLLPRFYPLIASC